MGNEYNIHDLLDLIILSKNIKINYICSLKLVHLHIKTYIYNNFLSFIIFMTTSNPLVSVIIPVYNTESFLDSCLWSVVQQTYKELEIIIVNDGSTDSTLEKMTEYYELVEVPYAYIERIKIRHSYNLYIPKK